MVEALHARQLLVVDDEPDSADLLAELLRLVLPHWDVAVAYGGSAALERGHRGRLDAVVLDIEMPGLDGFGVAAALRAAAQGRVPVFIAVSGNPLKVAAVRDMGAFDHAMTKPIDIAKLKALCEPP